MKRAIACLIAGVVLGSTSVGVAATSGYWSHKQDGVWCKNSGGNIACIPMSGDGFGVGISRDSVLVMNLDNSKTVFTRFQP